MDELSGGQLKNDRQFKDVLKELGRDPRVKRVIAKRRSRRKGVGKIERVSDVILVLSAIASRFAPEKRRPESSTS